MNAVAEAITPAARTTPRAGWLRNRTLLTGLGLLALIVAMAAFAPLLAAHDPNQQDLYHVLSGPSSQHWLGTDELGRDVWARLLYAGRIDLAIGVAAVVAPFVLGSILGLVAGYLGRWVDAVIMRVLDVVVAFPFYVHAARAAGFSTPRILFRHLAPNVVTQALLYAMSDVVLTILAVVTLGYLGLGVQPPTPEWGSMLQSGKDFLTVHPMLATAPGIAVVITGLALSLIGDGLAAELGRRA